MRMKIDTSFRPIADAQIEKMREDLHEALAIAQEAVIKRGEVLDALVAIRHYKTANKNVATHLKKSVASLRHVYVSESYGNLRLHVAWEPYNHPFRREVEWRFDKGISVQDLIDLINAQQYEAVRVESLTNQVQKFDLILAGEQELRDLLCTFERTRDEIKCEVFGDANGYFFEPIRQYLPALCAN